MAQAGYALALVLFLVGLYGMLALRSLIRKLIAMSLLQTAVIAFFITLAAKSGAGPPIAGGGEGPTVARAYVNPLPHALMLTAIVVGVATNGVGLALLIRIHRHYGTLDEADLLRRMRR